MKAIHLVYVIGIIALALMIPLWDHITWIGDNQHSVPFLVLTFFLATVDCTSSVLFVPYMSKTPSKYLVSHLIGQSLSGLIPSSLALIQGLYIAPCHST